MNLPVPALRRRLALWYAGTFTLTILAIALLMYVRLTRALEREFIDSLEALADEAAVIMRLHESEGSDVAEAAARTMAEVRYRDRLVFVLQPDGSPLGGAATESMDRRILEVGRAIGRTGRATVEFRGQDGQAWHAFGRTAAVAGDTVLILTVADRARTEAGQRRILGAFLVAGLLSVGAIVVVGMVLVRVSMRPISEVFEGRERFLADVAHELRAPLAVLRVQLDGARRRERDPGRDAETFEGAQAEVARMSRMVEDLLFLARAEAGVRPVHLKPCYLDDIVSDAVASAAPLAGGRGVRLRITDFEETPVHGDPDLLFQLVRALLDNAIKYTPPGGDVEVGVGTRDGISQLVVEDTGRGIEAVDLPRIFDRFYRSRSDTFAAGGAGLGLAVVRWIADTHHGTITADNRADGGARFTFRMHARAAAHPGPPADKPSPRRSDASVPS